MSQDACKTLLHAAERLLEAHEDQMVTSEEWDNLRSAAAAVKTALAGTTYYVATLSRYVYVRAADEASARVAGEAALRELYADVRERLGREMPIEIRTLRPATRDEMRDWPLHPEMHQ